MDETNLRNVSPSALKIRIGPPAISSPFNVTSASAPPVMSIGPARISVGRCSFAARNSRRTPGSSVMLGVSSKRPLSLNSTTPPPARASSAGWIGPGEATVVDRRERGIESRCALVFASAHRRAESIMKDHARQLGLRIAKRNPAQRPGRLRPLHSAVYAAQVVPAGSASERLQALTSIESRRLQCNMLSSAP